MGAVARSDQRKEDAHSLIGDEGEGVGRVNRLGRDDRYDVLDEIVAQPACLNRRQPLAVGQHDALLRQFLAQGPPHVLLGRFQFDHGFADRGQLLRRRHSVNRHFLDLALHLPGQTGHAHHHEFIEVAAGNRQIAQPLKQRVVGVARF